MITIRSIFRGKPVHLTTNEEGETDAPTGTDEEPSVIVQLSSRVQDGTRCRIGSLDMCIQGKCQVRIIVICPKCALMRNQYHLVIRKQRHFVVIAFADAIPHRNFQLAISNIRTDSSRLEFSFLEMYLLLHFTGNISRTRTIVRMI